MTAEQIIELVNSSTSLTQIFSDLFNWKSLLKEYLLQVHTDRCSLFGAQEATQKLLAYKSELENGKTHQDDAGTITYFPDHLISQGDINLLKKSLENYNIIKNLCIKDILFERYIPKQIKLNNNELHVQFENRAIPISSISSLPQQHLNWALSRLFEFLTFLNNNGYSLNGINPDSVYLIPENHGIQIVSFYHLTRLNSPVTTISGRYSNFYPEILFTEKITKNYIDVELAKRTIAYLGGDKSGLGLMFKKTHNKDWVDFIIKFHNEDTFLVFQKYRELLDKNFEKKFHKLDI